MSKESLFIHVDGMDLAGKTTITRSFINQSGLDWEIRRNRLSKSNPIHDLADYLRKEEIYDLEVIGNLYYAALMADIRDFQEPKTNTIQDSTIILRSIAFHTVQNTPRLPEMFKDLIKEHPKFDASFVFTANIEERKKRLEKRIKENPEQISSEDMMVINKPEKFLAMEKCLIDIAKANFNSKVIDTSNLVSEIAAKLMNDEIQTRKK